MPQHPLPLLLHHLVKLTWQESLTKEDVSFGNTALNFENTGDSFLFKYSATGEPVWANVINGESTQINAITYDNDGNIYVAVHIQEKQPYSTARTIANKQQLVIHTNLH